MNEQNTTGSFLFLGIGAPCLTGLGRTGKEWAEKTKGIEKPPCPRLPTITEGPDWWRYSPQSQQAAAEVATMESYYGDSCGRSWLDLPCIRAVGQHLAQ